MGIYINAIGCKGECDGTYDCIRLSDAIIFDKRFVKCEECPCVYNTRNCKSARIVNNLKLIFE